MTMLSFHNCRFAMFQWLGLMVNDVVVSGPCCCWRAVVVLALCMIVRLGGPLFV